MSSVLEDAPLVLDAETDEPKPCKVDDCGTPATVYIMWTCTCWGYLCEKHRNLYVGHSVRDCLYCTIHEALGPIHVAVEGPL